MNDKLCMRPLALALILVLGACGGSEDEPAPTGDTGGDVADTDPTQDTDPGEHDGFGGDVQDSDTGGDTGSDADTGSDSGSDVDTEEPLVVPATGTINEFRTHAAPPVEDLEYLSRETTYFRVGHELPEAETLHTLRWLDGRLWLGSSETLRRFDPASDSFVQAFQDFSGDVSFLGARVVELDDVRWIPVIRYGDPHFLDPDTGDLMRFSPFDGELRAILHDGGTLWGASDEGLFSLNEFGGWDAHPTFAEEEVYALAINDNRELAVATPNGLWLRSSSGDFEDLGVGGVAVLDVASCPDDSFAAVSADTLWIWHQGELHRIAAGHEGLPAADNRSVSCPQPGVYLVGHEIGVSLMEPAVGTREHYTSMRWMLGAPGIATALDGDGSRWFLSTEGVTRIDLVPRTLEEKATVRSEWQDERFRRLGGFITMFRHLQSWFSQDGSLLADDDNDGQWTQTMIGGWAFAKGATGDDRYCDDARPSVDNMLRLAEYACLTFAEAGLPCGYIARSFVRDDEGAVYDSKTALPNWHRVEPGDGHVYYWKDDTSSDELDGHAFGFSLFYDLCATDDERTRIRDVFVALTDAVIDGGTMLRGLDGEPTSDGRWDPLYVSSCVDNFATCMRVTRGDAELCASACFGGGYLNGMQILGQLLAAWHISSEERFYLEYERLIREHHYDQVITNVADVLTLHNAATENHSDHELMMLAYHTLIRYEPNPERLARWQAAMLEMYETERVERNPLWIAFVAGLTGQADEAEIARATLQEFPWDTRFFEVDNSHRVDLTLTLNDRHDEPQSLEVLPHGEMSTLWWNRNPHALVQGGGEREVAPAAWLVAYWAMRYYGLLE